MLNYKADKKPFWNQFFVSPLCDAGEQPIFFVAVHCEVQASPIDAEIQQVRPLAHKSQVTTQPHMAQGLTSHKDSQSHRPLGHLVASSRLDSPALTGPLFFSERRAVPSSVCCARAPLTPLCACACVCGVCLR